MKSIYPQENIYYFEVFYTTNIIGKKGVVQRFRFRFGQNYRRT